MYFSILTIKFKGLYKIIVWALNNFINNYIIFNIGKYLIIKIKLIFILESIFLLKYLRLIKLLKMLTKFSIFNTIYNDAPQPWQLGFQDSASPSFTGIVELHNSIFFFLVVIAVGIFWVLGSTMYYYSSKNSPIVHKYLNHGTLIELIWTITPALILISIAFPSFRLLYLLDEVISPTITIKVVGHQWYWSYEYSDYVNESGESIEFDSYMIPESDLELGQFRVLEVDNKVIVPVDTHVRIIVTGADVIHSFTVPSLGIKIDTVPGRLNQTSLLAERTGTFYGQCSEICGVYHGFMPIAIESVSVQDYLAWVDAQ